MTNNDEAVEVAEVDPRLRSIQPDDEDKPKFRELKIEPPQPPWHLALVPPVEFDGKKYEELVFDYDSMIGKDFHRIERMFYRTYKSERNEVVLPEMRQLYHNLIAADVAQVPVGLIMKLPRRYYVAVRNEAVKACGSSPEEEKA
jgi:hypothetical protein